MTTGRGIEGLVLDFDGVLHWWAGEGERIGEHAEGLPSGALAEAAYCTTAHEHAKLGIISDAEWRRSVAES